MKVYNEEGKHVKTVPKKFGVFSDTFIISRCYNDTKRPSEHERDLLEVKLVDFYFSLFLSELNDVLTEIYISRNIDDYYIPELRKVQRNDGTHDFELYFSETNSVRVSRSDFPECVYTTGFRY